MLQGEKEGLGEEATAGWSAVEAREDQAPAASTAGSSLVLLVIAVIHSPQQHLDKPELRRNCGWG